jgi:hypothetical protein
MIHGCRLAGEMEKEDNPAWVSRESSFRRIRFLVVFHFNLAFGIK